MTIAKFIQTRFSLILIFVFLFTSVSSFGQKHFEKGYVILNNNDTLYGAVMDRKPHPFGSLFKKIRFRGKKGKRKYGPKQILGYKKGNSVFETVWVSSSRGFLNQNYSSVPRQGKPNFLRVVEKGFLTHYHWEYEDQDSGYIDYVAYFKKENGISLVRVNQGILGLKRKNLARFFADCPPLVQKIIDKELKSPAEIVRFYNTWKEN